MGVDVFSAGDFNDKAPGTDAVRYEDPALGIYKKLTLRDGKLAGVILVGDTSDGYPGLPGWGAKSSAAVLAKFIHLEAIPADYREWHVNAANASSLAATLTRERETALLFRRLATLRTDIPLFNNVDELQWRGLTKGYAEYKSHFDSAVTDPRKSSTRR